MARCINFVADISELHYELHCRIHKRAGENQISQLVFNFRKYPLQQRMHAAFQLLYIWEGKSSRACQDFSECGVELLSVRIREQF